MLRIAVCDDNRTDIEQLEQAFDVLKIKNLDYDVYFGAEELLREKDKDDEAYQIYILDIEMPGTSGLELAKEIRKTDAKALIIFLTSYTDYVMEVFDVITFDYVCKPITQERLEAVIWKAMNFLHLVKRDFVFSYRKNQYRVSCEDILYIEKKGRQAFIHTVNEVYRSNMTLEEIWEQLDEKVFVHIHISYIVNLGHVSAIDGDDIVLDSKEQLLIARTHKQNVKEKHLSYVREMV